MLVALLLLAAGTVLVAVGAESAVRGAARFALATGIPAFALGALLFGLDFEGTAGALIAAGRGQTTLSAGEVYGTIIFLFSAAFGAALLGRLATLDEVLLETLPIRRGRPELATGNLFGTVAAFTSLVPGLAALIHPLVLDGAAAVAFLGAAGLYTLVAVAFLARDRAWRVLGVVVLVAYAAWLVYAASL